MTSGFDLWRAIDAEGGARENQWADGYNAGLGQASMHVERLGYFEGDIVLPKATVGGLLEALKTLIPTNVSLGNPAWPDDTVVPIDFTLGELRAARAAISLAGEYKS